MSTNFRVDQLVLWDHPNSHLVIQQTKRLLSQYDIFLDTGFQEFRLSDAKYETEKIDRRCKSFCKFTMPGTKDTVFVANGGLKCDKYTSMRLATFRVIKKIIGYLFGFDWDRIEFKLIDTREGGYRCKSNKIRLPTRGRDKNKKESFSIERVTRPYGPKKNYPAYCRIGAAIEFMDKLCSNLEFVGPLPSMRRRRRRRMHRRSASPLGSLRRDERRKRRLKHSDRHRRASSVNPSPLKRRKLHHRHRSHDKDYGKDNFSYFKKYYPDKKSVDKLDKDRRSMSISKEKKPGKHIKDDNNVRILCRSNYNGHIIKENGSHSLQIMHGKMIKETVESEMKSFVGNGFGVASLDMNIKDNIPVHSHNYNAVTRQISVDENLVNVQKNLQYEPGALPKRKSVDEWNYYGLIYWFNRVNNNAFAHIKYSNLRKHLYIGKVKGSELSKINDVLFKMIGLRDKSDHELIMKAINDLIAKDDFNNIVANALLTDDIPYCYFDPITHEIMQDPVILNVSGNTHERRIIEQYIKSFGKDPITGNAASLGDLTPNIELKNRIDIWIRDNFNLNVV